VSVKQRRMWRGRKLQGVVVGSVVVIVVVGGGGIVVGGRGIIGGGIVGVVVARVFMRPRVIIRGTHGELRRALHRAPHTLARAFTTP